MRTSVELDGPLEKELKRAVSATREKREVVLRLAIRAGLPLVASQFQPPRPEGYFQDCYPEADERHQLKEAMLRAPQRRRR
jgi:hypothetical protein